MPKFGSKESISINPNNNVEEEMNKYDVRMSASAIPDLDGMLLLINEMLEFIDSPEMKDLENSFLDDFTLANNLEDKASTLNEDTDADKILSIKRQVAKLRKIAKKKKERFENNIYGRYNSKLPMKIISLLAETERDSNLDDLLDMFERLKAVKLGKANIETEADKFGEKLRNKYVYEHFGGKEGYEKIIQQKR